MNVEALRAAERIKAAAPERVRVHHARPRPKLPLKRHGEARNPRYFNSRPVRVYGKEYPSMTIARKAMKVGITTLYRMIDRGEAEYVA